MEKRRRNVKEGEGKRMKKEERERREREERERKERRAEEQERRWKRRKNVVWRGLDGEDQEERRVLLEKMMEVTLDRKAGIIGSWEVRGDDGKMIVIVEMENAKDKRELLEKGKMMWRKWEIGIDEDLTREEMRIRWMMIERARRERAREKEATISGKRIWIEGEEWEWNEEEQRLEKKIE